MAITCDSVFTLICGGDFPLSQVRWRVNCLAPPCDSGRQECCVSLQEMYSLHELRNKGERTRVILASRVTQHGDSGGIPNCTIRRLN